MKLGELLPGVPRQEIVRLADAEIAHLAYDSRRVGPQSLFFAIQGEKADGHRFIPQALERGAVAIVSERSAPPEFANYWVRVSHIRRALGEAAGIFFGHPDRKLEMVGITGTNGKTTTSYLLESVFQSAGMPCGVFGTIAYRFSGRSVEAINTTPESLDLFAYLDELVRSGGKAAAMEVSSHALAQERVWGIRFGCAIFTNLTRDHLDYHGDFEHYFLAKRRLFEGLGTPPPDISVLNIDDSWTTRLLELGLPYVITYGLDPAAQVRPVKTSHNGAGMEATLSTPQGNLGIRSALVGRANLMNILAATAAGIALGLDPAKIAQGIEALRAVPGRLERVDEGQPFLVLVDYAHTDDALKNVLTTARELTRRRLIVVFGCGGDRDRTKRPLMGEVAGTLADLAVLTSDNPRSEDPLRIMSDALVGLQKTGKPYLAEVDREAAIRKALETAGPGDVVVLAGKGHETYQVLKDRTIPFDDREVARRMLRELGWPKGNPPGRPNSKDRAARNSKS